VYTWTEWIEDVNCHGCLSYEPLFSINTLGEAMWIDIAKMSEEEVYKATVELLRRSQKLF